MAFRGRGRGRGGGRGSFFENRAVKHEPYILFPEDVILPAVPGFPLPTEEQMLVTGKAKLEHFWKHSCYHLEEAVPKSSRTTNMLRLVEKCSMEKGKQDAEIERYSDRFNKSKTEAKREALASYLKLTPSNFPPELIQGSKRVQPDKKKLRWGRDSDEQLSDMFEKLEEKDVENEGKEKKDESEDEEEAEEVEEESSDDDYNQNIDFDDDEDDMNMEEEEHEDYYE